MGKKAATISVSSVVAVVFISLVFMQPVRVDAASLSDQLVKRLCDRQEKLGGRLARALINPSRCATTPPPEEEEPTVILTADPMTITVGSSTTLTWNSDNATTCTASNGWSGDKALDGSQSVSPATTTTYAISCTGDGGTANDSVTVTVNAAPVQPTLEFTASPTEITSTGTSTLSWASTNATSCTASGGWSGAKSLSGNQIVSPNATTTYSLTCTGAGGDITKNVTVNFVPDAPVQPTVDLSASRTTVHQNSSSTATTTLTWTTTNATSCTASGGAFVGTKVVNDSETITPTATTTYMLECTGPGGSASDSVEVFFVPAVAEEPDPTLSFSASRMTVNENSSSTATTTLTWDSSNATSCTASGATEWSGSKDVDGTLTVTPIADVTYALDCNGPGGNVHQEVVIDFIPIAPVEGKLLITEVIYDLGTGQGSEPGNEWVELYNGTNATINLAGWFLHDASTTDALPDVNIPAGQFAFITGSSTSASLWPSMPGGTVIIQLLNSTIGNGLGNDSDVVWLENTASSTVDAVSWGSNTFAFNPGVADVVAGHSIARTSKTLDVGDASDWFDNASPNPGQ